MFSTGLLITIAVGVVFTALFYFALTHRWFAHLSRGYLIVLMLCLVGLSLLSEMLVGLWSYDSARRIMYQQIVGQLENVGDVVQGQIKRDIDHALAQLKQLAKVVAAGAEGRDGRQTSAKFAEVQELNPRLLQLRLTDATGKILAERSVTGLIDPMNRVAAAVSIEGKTFASDPFIAPAFKKYVLNLSVPVLSGKGDVIGTLGARYDLQQQLQDMISTTKFNVSGYAVVVSSEGRIIAHPNPSRLHDDVSGYPAVKLASDGHSGSVEALNKAGEKRLMIYRPLESPATFNPKPMILLTEIKQSEADAPLVDLKKQLLIAMGVMIVLSLLIAIQVSLSLKKPVQELVHMAESVQQGDLTARVEHQGRDELGQLASALNKMVEGLQERDHVKEVFGQYVTTQVSEKVLQGNVNLGGESRVVTILFSDIRNFTAMSEQMTPTEVVSFLNNYFSEMVDAVFEQGGVLDKFIGDGLMAVFGSFGEVPDHAARAVRAGLRMKALLGKINGERAIKGQAPIAIGVGIHTDEVILGNIGSRKRLQYTAIGDGVNTSSRVESLNKELGTTLLITESTYELVRDEFECRAMPAAHVKGKSKPLQVYEVLSGKG